jgi:hydroxymethylglutaryl-CoA synthase
MAARPSDVGILSIELYAPSTYLDQAELEVYDKVARGKYLYGLGQLRLSVFGDREDVNSISLTVLHNLLTKNNIDPKRVGRLEVGTETLIDKSKSTKTVLMNLFKASGNMDIEGVTSLNACFGGVQALYNTVAWIESSAWDGRLGVVVLADIAVYAKGPARATNGGGAVALLIGPNAPLVLETQRTSYVDDVYDFYKPDPASEYPQLSGAFSIECYLTALSDCYTRLAARNGSKRVEEFADFFCFHTPYYKMVKRAFNRLVHLDVLRHPELHGKLGEMAKERGLLFTDRNHYSVLDRYTEPLWHLRGEPATTISKTLGNLYSGALPASLLSLICDPSVDLLGKRVLMFSYGSGLAASMFVLYVKPDSAAFIAKMRENNPIRAMLQSRIQLHPGEFTRRMTKRERDYGRKNYQPEDPIAEIQPGAFYLARVDEKWRRFYEQKAPGAPRL